MSSTGVATVLALIGGLAGSLQVAVMGRLGDRIGALEASAFAFVLTSVAGAVILLVARRSLAGYADAVRQPAWMWLGGLMGVFIVTSITVAAPRIGTTATVALLIVGQLVTGTLIDRFGWFGVAQIPIGWPRVAGLVLLAVGTLLTLRT